MSRFVLAREDDTFDMDVFAVAVILVLSLNRAPASCTDISLIIRYNSNNKNLCKMYNFVVVLAFFYGIICSLHHSLLAVLSYPDL